ncbi:glutaredoxin family protein [Marinospirillum insulare]|uniref:Thioredoxin family protein n=1 Tax=Marinospirillum insulare TaxID=217169 RepID=A0ABQ5ZRI8_9GAMM|nr:glutaredoxin family protein [Marinospirillum insulare]GLR62584.1 thioredoxin family protein [Marinospirillum insulare]
MAEGLHLTLYTTEGCHLCDEALALLNPWLAKGLGLALVDIAEDDLLMARYSVRIPVIASPSGVELGWPFSAEGLASWIQNLPENVS